MAFGLVSTWPEARSAISTGRRALLVPAVPAMAQSEFSVTPDVEEELPILLPTPQGENTFYVCLDGTWGQVQIVETAADT